MRLRRLHSWNLSPARARALQEALRRRVRERPLRRSPRLVAACDCASGAGSRIHAAAILYEMPGVVEVGRASASLPLRFPYVPGLLSFREAPVMLEALSRLEPAPEAVLVDAHGKAHPRRFGEACHVGLWLGLPTLGIAKSVLVGRFGALGRLAGSWAPLVHEGETVGAALRPADGVKPVFVSPGHLIDLPGALRIARSVSDGYRLPKPLREADRWSKELARS